MENKFSYKFANLTTAIQLLSPNITFDNNGIVYHNSEDANLGRYDNLYPQKLIEILNDKSSTHSNFISKKQNLIAGKGVQPRQNSTPELESFLKNVNRWGQTMDQLTKELSFDLAVHEAAAIQVIWNVNRDAVTDIIRMPIPKIRMYEANEYDIVEKYCISNDWSDISSHKYDLPAFNRNTKNPDPRQLIYIKNETGQLYYNTPSYASGLIYVEIEKILGKYNYAQVNNGFFAGGLLQVNQDMTQEEEDKFFAQFLHKFAGAENANKILMTKGEDGKPAMTFTPIQFDNNDGKLKFLNDITVQKIATSHGGSPELAGIFAGGADLGGDANKILTMETMFKLNKINPYQELLSNTINMILDINKLPDIEMVNEMPLQLMDKGLIQYALSKDEIRKKLFGMDPIVVNTQPAMEISQLPTSPIQPIQDSPIKPIEEKNIEQK